MSEFLIVLCVLVVYCILAFAYYNFACSEWQESKPEFIFLITWFMHSMFGDGYEGGDDRLGFGKILCFFLWWLFLAIDLVIIAIGIVPYGIWLLFQIPDTIASRKFEKEFHKAMEEGTIIVD